MIQTDEKIEKVSEMSRAEKQEAKKTYRRIRKGVWPLRFINWNEFVMCRRFLY